MHGCTPPMRMNGIETLQDLEVVESRFPRVRRLRCERDRALPQLRTARPRRSQDRIGELRLAIQPPLTILPDPEGRRPATTRRGRPRRFRGEET